MAAVPKILSKGFTLIEILIVIIIVAIMAGLAVPVYQAQVQRAYEKEALLNLGHVRRAVLRRYAQYGTYNNISILSGSCNIDYCPNSASNSGQTAHFQYDFVALQFPPNTFQLWARRNLVDGGDNSSTITIDQAGTINRAGIFD